MAITANHWRQPPMTKPSVPAVRGSRLATLVTEADVATIAANLLARARDGDPACGRFLLVALGRGGARAHERACIQPEFPGAVCRRRFSTPPHPRRSLSWIFPRSSMSNPPGSLNLMT